MMESSVTQMSATTTGYHPHLYHHQQLDGGGNSRKLSEYLGGSMSSVATVKEIKPSSSPTAEMSPMVLADDMKVEDSAEAKTAAPGVMNCDSIAMDLDIGQIYDDVMQCVYDDVDTKYDDITTTLVEGADSSGVGNEPPVPPLRKRGLSMDRGVVDRPLPITPRQPTLIDKIAEKKNELLRERERELERRRVFEEAKRKEREMAEEAKRVEREEKEKRKQEERERRRQEEELKRSQKKREEEDKRAKREQQQQQQGEVGGSGLLGQSLFQRLFQRTTSSSARPGEEGTEMENSQTSGGE
jgi:hypothetical protein